ncbi:MAG: DUF4867 family protein [Lachnospiraceae bacterium]|nr:DUF4867 family protein [Lachnospiraceae bacterium]
MKIRTVYEPEFTAYGRVVKGYDTAALTEAMLHTPLPEDVVYVASVPELEALPIAAEFADGIYGQMPIQIGYCNGHNKKLNALEYHRDSEVNLAVTDLVLLIGKQQDITEDYTYDTSLVEAFFVPAGTLIEVYATTLHYAPCHAAEEGFRCVVVLPKGTNEELKAIEKEHNTEDKLLFAKNKWLVGHREGGLPDYAWFGLTGENITLE